MNPSLSVIMPVHNAQRWLVERVMAILEILPELTPRFDLFVVDDGSTDQTYEIAHDLACRYPQIRVARHAMQHGHCAAVETGLRNTTGEIVIVQDVRSPVSPSQLRQLWRMRLDQRLVMASPESQSVAETAGLMQRLVKWAAALSTDHQPVRQKGSPQLIRRSTVQQLNGYAEPDSWLSVERNVRTDPLERDTLANRNPKFLLRLKEFMKDDG